MATRNDRLTPARLIHPGEILKEELKERGIKQKDFAAQIGVQPSHLNEFIHGKRDLNDKLAFKLQEHLGVPYNVWMKIHIGYICDKRALEEQEEDT